MPLLALIIAASIATAPAQASPLPEDLTHIDKPKPTSVKVDLPLVDELEPVVDTVTDIVHLVLIGSAVAAPSLWAPQPDDPEPVLDLDSRRRIEDPDTWSKPPSTTTLRFTSDLGRQGVPGFLLRGRW